MKKVFFIGIVFITLIGCSKNIEREQCDYYLAYENAYKPKDLNSIDDIPQIYGFDVDVNNDERVITFKFTDGHKEKTKATMCFTPSMINNMTNEEIIQCLGEDYHTKYGSIMNSNIIFLQLDNGNSLHVSIDDFYCDYYVGDTRIKYPFDERRFLINIMPK